MSDISAISFAFFNLKVGRFISDLPLKSKLILSGLLNLITFNLIILLFLPTTPALATLCTCNIVVWILDVFVAFYARDIDWSYKIMAIYGLISTTLHALALGGLYSSYLFWLPIITLGMSNFLSNFYAIVSMAYSILIYSVFLWMQLSGMVDFRDDIYAVPPLLDYMNFVCVVIMLGLIHYFFFTQVSLNLIWKKKSEQKVGYLENILTQKETELQKMRNDMSQDFHDEMGNKLATITMLSTSLKLKLDSQFSQYKDESKLLDIIQTTATEVFEGTKDFIWSVDYKSDLTFELFIYLREFGERFFNHLEINFRSSYLPDTDVPYRLYPLAGRQLIMICKEIMTNAAKHSKCQDFVLEMALSDGVMCIYLQDNGKGFDITTSDKRGLHNISQRCKGIHAICSLKSDKNGTSFHVKVPVLPETHSEI